MTTKRRPSWRERVAEGLWRTGSLHLLQRLSQFVEFHDSAPHGSLRLRRVTHPKFLILCYHRVGTEGIPFYSTQTIESFSAQMQFLRKNYRIISLGELLQELRDPGRFRQAVVVTFDDGYRDVYNYAFPILHKYRIPATIYLTAGCIESGEVAWYDRIFLALQVFQGDRLQVDLNGPICFSLSSRQSRVLAAIQIIASLRKLPNALRVQFCRSIESQVTLPESELAGRMLTWDQILEMQRAGMFFGAHTLTHPVVSRLSEEDFDFELRQSKRLIEDRLQTQVLDFAYPFGQPSDCGEAAPGVVARCGFRSAVTTVRGVSVPDSDPYRLRRAQFADESSTAIFALQLNRLFWCVRDGVPSSRRVSSVFAPGTQPEDSAGLPV